MMGTYKTTTEMVDLYVDLISKFPSIIALIDPFRKEVKGSALSFIIKPRSFGSAIWNVLSFGLGMSCCLPASMGKGTY